MEYVYAAMLLHKAGNKVDESSMKKVLEAASIKVDTSRVRALVAALEGVNIDEAIEKSAAVAAAPVAAAPAASASGEASAEKKKEEKPKEEEASQADVAAGLGALFG